MRDDRGRLEDILEAIDKIEKYVSKRNSHPENDELIETWVIHHLQIIGEAARGLSSAFRKKYAGVPWPEIIAMRNILVHQYFEVEDQEVWSTVKNDIPDLKQKIQSILKLFSK